MHVPAGLLGPDVVHAAELRGAQAVLRHQSPRQGLGVGDGQVLRLGHRDPGLVGQRARLRGVRDRTTIVGGARGALLAIGKLSLRERGGGVRGSDGTEGRGRAGERAAGVLQHSAGDGEPGGGDSDTREHGGVAQALTSRSSGHVSVLGGVLLRQGVTQRLTTGTSAAFSHARGHLCEEREGEEQQLSPKLQAVAS